MNNSWRFFIITEALLLLLVLWQLIHTGSLLFLLIAGCFFLALGMKKKRRKTTNKFQMVIGILFLVIALVNIPVVWVMLVLGIVFTLSIGKKNFSAENGYPFPWKKKQMLMIETINAQERKGKRYKRSWIENERIGNNIYEWDDINIDIFSGDTIVDLGNTLLPKEDNVIIIRKGFGRTRVLVPLGVAIQLEHSTFYGCVRFEEELYQLKNESIKIYSDDFDTNSRRLKIITNALVGDVEVIRL